eukprot:2412040-Alexandrium_andersonii.AAC.1
MTPGEVGQVLSQWQHGRGLPEAGIAQEIASRDANADMMQCGEAVPLEDNHPFLAPLDPTAQQYIEFNVSWHE